MLETIETASESRTLLILKTGQQSLWLNFSRIWAYHQMHRTLRTGMKIEKFDACAYARRNWKKSAPVVMKEQMRATSAGGSGSKYDENIGSGCMFCVFLLSCLSIV